MSCCGSSRHQVANPSGPTGASPPPRGRAVRPLEYVGATALTTLGPATGRIYRFTAPGARLSVDPRDWASLARLAQLRPV